MLSAAGRRRRGEGLLVARPRRIHGEASHIAATLALLRWHISLPAVCLRLQATPRYFFLRHLLLHASPPVTPVHLPPSAEPLLHRYDRYRSSTASSLLASLLSGTSSPCCEVRPVALYGFVDRLPRIPADRSSRGLPHSPGRKLHYSSHLLAHRPSPITHHSSPIIHHPSPIAHHPLHLLAHAQAPCCICALPSARISTPLASISRCSRQAGTSPSSSAPPSATSVTSVYRLAPHRLPVSRQRVRLGALHSSTQLSLQHSSLFNTALFSTALSSTQLSSTQFSLPSYAAQANSQPTGGRRCALRPGCTGVAPDAHRSRHHSRLLRRAFRRDRLRQGAPTLRTGLPTTRELGRNLDRGL